LHNVVNVRLRYAVTLESLLHHAQVCLCTIIHMLGTSIHGYSLALTLMPFIAMCEFYVTWVDRRTTWSYTC